MAKNVQPARRPEIGRRLPVFASPQMDSGVCRSMRPPVPAFRMSLSGHEKLASIPISRHVMSQSRCAPRSTPNGASSRFRDWSRGSLPSAGSMKPRRRCMNLTRHRQYHTLGFGLCPSFGRGSEPAETIRRFAAQLFTIDNAPANSRGRLGVPQEGNAVLFLVDWYATSFA